MNAVDTNVLIYAHGPRDRVKQTKALSLIRSLSDAVLLWQVACEYLSASRKLEPFGYRWDHAWEDIRDLRRVWMTMLPSWGVVDRARELMRHHSLAYWDAMVVGACLEGGVECLYTEDFGVGSTIDSLRIVDPFG